MNYLHLRHNSLSGPLPSSWGGNYSIGRNAFKVWAWMLLGQWAWGAVDLIVESLYVEPSFVLCRLSRFTWEAILSQAHYQAHGEPFPCRSVAELSCAKRQFCKIQQCLTVRTVRAVIYTGCKQKQACWFSAKRMEWSHGKYTRLNVNRSPAGWWLLIWLPWLSLSFLCWSCVLQYHYDDANL